MMRIAANAPAVAPNTNAAATATSDHVTAYRRTSPTR